MVDRKFRLPRVWSNIILRDIAPLFNGDIINISGWLDNDKEGSKYRDYFINANSYTISNYKGERGYSGESDEILLDLESNLDKKYYDKYDVCFNHTTLEHIYDFHKAFNNICNMTRDIVILIVPFAQMQHETDSFKDYWRFSPSSLKRMFEDNSLKIVYNNVNNHINSGIYLFYIGSKQPELWSDKFDNLNIKNNVGSWIGERFLKRLIKKII